MSWPHVRSSPVARLAGNFSQFVALLLWAGSALAWLGGMPQLSIASSP
jgi:hypothetical protein